MNPRVKRDGNMFSISLDEGRTYISHIMDADEAIQLLNDLQQAVFAYAEEDKAGAFNVVALQKVA